MSATFTGSSYLSIANVPASQTIKGSPVSFAIWVRPTAAGGQIIDTSTLGLYLAIVSSNTTPTPPPTYNDTIAIFNDSVNGTWFLDLEQTNFAEELTAQGDTTVLNAWVHYAATYSGSNTNAGMLLYKNGALISNTASGAALTSTIAWNRVVVGGFAGDAQDAFCFNRVLTAGEISDLYLGRAQRVSTANIVGHWPLYGDNLGLDISGQGRNLTATGTVVKGSNNAPTAQWHSGSQIALRTVLVSTTTAITGEGDLKSAGTGSLYNLISDSAANVSSAGSGSLFNLLSDSAANVSSAGSAAPQNLISDSAANVSSAGSASTQNLIAATGAMQSAGSTSAQNLIAATGAVQSAGSASAVNLVSDSAANVSSAGSASAQNLISDSAANISSAGSATPTVSVALSDSAGSIQSAGTGTLFQLATATGAVQSAGSGTLTSVVPLTAEGDLLSAGTATPQNLVSSSGDLHSAGSGTLALSQAITASGGIQSAGTALPLSLATATGALASAGSATAQSLTAASGNVSSAASAVVLNLFTATGGVRSAATGTLAVTYLMTGTGGIQSAGFGTLTGGIAPPVTGGPFKGNVPRRTMYAGRRRMRII